MNPLFLLVHLGLACKKPVKETPPPVETAPVVEPEAKEEVKAAPSQLPAEIMQLVQNFQKVYFDLDAAVLSEDSKAALSQNVTILQKHADIRLEIQGHADERGTTEYNLALGQRRADTVAKYLSASGIAPSRLKVVSYGEEKPLSLDGSESAFSKNRRCEFVIVWGGEGIKGSDESSEEGSDQTTEGTE